MKLKPVVYIFSILFSLSTPTTSKADEAVGTFECSPYQSSDTRPQPPKTSLTEAVLTSKDDGYVLTVIFKNDGQKMELPFDSKLHLIAHRTYTDKPLEISPDGKFNVAVAGRARWCTYSGIAQLSPSASTKLFGKQSQVSQSSLKVPQGNKVGTTTCEHVYRGQGKNTRPIQNATLEPKAGGYTLRFTEIIQGKPIETVWELDNGLIIDTARTGELPEGRWNLVPYNRYSPVIIQPTGAFSINMMVSSRSICTFTGTLQFTGNTRAQLFPGSSSQTESGTGLPDSESPQKQQHWSLKANVRISKPLEKHIDQVANFYYQATGKTLVITDGDRTAGEQAQQILNILKTSGVEKARTTYIQKSLINEIIVVFQKNTTDANRLVAMTDTIQNQIDQGKYVSKHLKRGAFDVRIKDMSPDDKKALEKAIEAAGGKRLDESSKQGQPHYHVQFSID